jgi:hypothetical protein
MRSNRKELMRELPLAAVKEGYFPQRIGGNIGTYSGEKTGEYNTNAT